MHPFAPHTILLLVANPVDTITHLAQHYAALPRAQVLGTGTFLDSARLRGLLAAKARVAASHIDAYVLGEHGDSQFVAWSAASIAGVPLDRALPPGVQIDRDAIAADTKSKAARIIANKGATNFGIGGVAASICRSILCDERVVRPVSHWQERLGVCLSLPAVLGRGGVLRTVELGLESGEEEALKRSAEALKGVVGE